MGRPRKGNSRFGTVNQLPSGNWRARYQLDGEFYNKSGFVTSKEAWAWLATIHNSVATGTHITRHLGDKTFAEVAQEWLEHIRSFYDNPGTVNDYRAIVTAGLLPKLGQFKIGDFDAKLLRKFFVEESERYKPATMRKRKVALGLIFSFACENGYTSSNPVDFVRVKSADQEEMVFLNQLEVLALANACGSPYSFAVQLAAYSGLRAGELWDLKVKSLDFFRNCVQVVSTVRAISGHGMVSKQCTKNGGWRSVPVPKGLMGDLRKFVKDKDPEDFVFTTESGTQVRHDNFRNRIWDIAIVDSGIKKKPRFHDMRHTCAAFYFAQQRTGEEVRRVLGHSSIQTTHRHYAHIFPEAFDQMGEGIDAFRSQGLEDFMKQGGVVSEVAENASCHGSVTPLRLGGDSEA